MPQEQDANRSNRLLRAMHTTLSHDLPNQLVTLRGLLQMLEVDQGLGASASAREMLNRLRRVAGKTSDQVRFLRDLERLSRHVCRLAKVRLADLIREVKTELQVRFAEVPIECKLAGKLQTAVADVQLLTRALVELFSCFVENKHVGTSALQLAAHESGANIELRGELRWPVEPVESAGRPSPISRIAPENCLEVALAQELLAVGGGRLMEISENANCGQFCVLLPQASAHG